MRKHKIIYFFYIFIIFIVCACDDPVFYAISQEIKPIEPRISGVPTNFAVFGERMYIASGHAVFSYNYNTGVSDPDKQYWKREPGPGGNVLQIASTGGNLYALCATDQNNDGRTTVKRLDKDNSMWISIGGILNNYAKIQNIFAAGDYLFIWAALSTLNYNYNILYIKNGSNDALNISDNQDDMGIITGAAFNGTSCFLPFTSKKTDKDKISGGVYKIDDASGGASVIAYKNQEGNAVNIHFNGIINLGEDAGNTILLISRNGEIYTINDSDNSIEKTENASMGRLSTGALAIWRDKDLPGKMLLLAGRQDSLYYSSTYGYSYGYMELELDAAGVKSGASFTEPGRNPSFSTLPDYERYKSSLGKYPVNYIFQAPPEIDSNMTLFASTQINGVWSCRDRDRNSNKYWNAEGEDEPRD
jgi:hypothetical protein